MTFAKHLLQRGVRFVIERSGERERLLHAGSAQTVRDVVRNVEDRDVAVSQQLLHGPDVVTILQEMRRERVTQRVRARWLGQPGLPDSALDGPLQR